MRPAVCEQTRLSKFSQRPCHLLLHGDQAKFSCPMRIHLVDKTNIGGCVRTIRESPCHSREDGSTRQTRGSYLRSRGRYEVAKVLQVFLSVNRDFVKRDLGGTNEVVVLAVRLCCKNLVVAKSGDQNRVGKSWRFGPCMWWIKSRYFCRPVPHVIFSASKTSILGSSYVVRTLGDFTRNLRAQSREHAVESCTHKIS